MGRTLSDRVRARLRRLAGEDGSITVLSIYFLPAVLMVGGLRSTWPTRCVCVPSCR